MAKSSDKEKSNSITARFVQSKETPGAFQFTEVDSDGNKVETANAKIGSLYLRKSALNGVAPAKLKVTVSLL